MTVGLRKPGTPTRTPVTPSVSASFASCLLVLDLHAWASSYHRAGVFAPVYSALLVMGRNEKRPARSWPFSLLLSIK